MSRTKTHYRACHLCEAICGLEIKTEDDEILSIRGDKKDPLSNGFICPKATALADLHSDADRIRKPMQRIGEEWHEIEWDQAFDMAAEKLVEIQNQYGADALGFYAGNPNVHNYGNLTHGPQLRRALRTRNNFSATSLDQLPHHLVSYLMYGHQSLLPIPDIDHTQCMIIFGGNPVASNGSIMTVPNFSKRIKALQARGGKLIVVDPRRNETAELADQHLFIRPGSDAFVLLAIINELLRRGAKAEQKWNGLLSNIELLSAATTTFTLEEAAKRSGIERGEITALVDQLLEEKTVIYGRMGVSVQEFGTICQWAIQVINILTGALDSVGGALVSSPAFGYIESGTGGQGHFDRFQSRVRKLPEFAGELPAIAMAEEILTPGEGQIRGMVTIAGNPLISSADSEALEKAFASLDFYLAIDFYVNASTRHAHLILPPASPLEREHYDIAFLRLAVRNTTRYNPAIFDKSVNSYHDWEILDALTARVCALKGQPSKPLPTPETIVAQGIDSASHGIEGLSLEGIKQRPHGLDLGPLKPSLAKRICNDNGKIDVAPQVILDDLSRLKQTPSSDQLLLIGRRHVRSNNSWMHNYHRLVKGPTRWQLLMHPNDLAARGIEDNTEVRIRSNSGSITTTVSASEEMMPGVVSLPHGWGHQKKGIKMQIASQQMGQNCNRLTDSEFFDKLSGNAALNAVPVEVSVI